MVDYVVQVIDRHKRTDKIDRKVSLLIRDINRQILL